MPAQDIRIDYVPIFKDNYIWLIINPAEKKAIAIDPGDASSLENFLHKNLLQLTAILITHHHWDHTNGISDLKKHYSIPIYGPHNPSIPGISQFVQEPDNLTVSFLENTMAVLNTPGHTLDHISYLWQGMLFCGDTLFSAGCGRVFEGTAKQMFHSLQTIAALPDDTKIYCTHEYTMDNLQFAQLVEPNNQAIHTKIQQVKALRQKNLPTLPAILKEEKNINPFLRCHSPEIISSVEKHVGTKLENTVAVFKALREWKNNVS